MDSYDPLLAQLLGQPAHVAEMLSTPSSQNAEASTSSYATAPAPPRRVQGVGCDTCRLRKVKCDLHIKIAKAGCDKDTLKALSPVELGVACTGCETRGIRCTTDWQRTGKKAKPRTGSRLKQAMETFGSTDTSSAAADIAEPWSQTAAGRLAVKPTQPLTTSPANSNARLWDRLWQFGSAEPTPIPLEVLASMDATAQTPSSTSSKGTLWGLTADDGLGRSVLGQELNR